jgi:hypothetical protein
MSFRKKKKGQEGKTGSIWGLVPVGGCKKRVKKGKYGGNSMYSCMKMKRDLSTLLKMEEGEIKENDGGGEFI